MTHSQNGDLDQHDMIRMIHARRFYPLPIGFHPLPHRFKNAHSQENLQAGSEAENPNSNESGKMAPKHTISDEQSSDRAAKRARVISTIRQSRRTLQRAGSGQQDTPAQQNIQYPTITVTPPTEENASSTMHDNRGAYEAPRMTEDQLHRFRRAGHIAEFSGSFCVPESDSDEDTQPDDTMYEAPKPAATTSEASQRDAPTNIASKRVHFVDETLQKEMEDVPVHRPWLRPQPLGDIFPELRSRNWFDPQAKANELMAELQASFKFPEPELDPEVVEWRREQKAKKAAKH